MTSLTLSVEPWPLLLMVQITYTGIHALEVAELRVLAFGKGWGAFPTTLIGTLTHSVAYGYIGVSCGFYPNFVSLKHDSLSQSQAIQLLAKLPA